MTQNGKEDAPIQQNSTVRPKLPTPSFDLNFTSDLSNLWDDSAVLPQWMKHYFAWHRHHRSQITPDNWKEYRYCVMRCLDTDSRCGGAADRIKTVPLMLYWAARSKRILMLYWSRPAALEAFLLPPEGGIDWRVPKWMVKGVVHGRAVGNVDNLPELFHDGINTLAISTKVQSYNGGSLFYNENVEGPRFENIFHDMWRTMFTPTIPIQHIIQQHLERFNLRPGEYAAAHVRGRYGKRVWPDKVLFGVTENAINCASNLRPAGPIYFASDSKRVVDHVMEKVAPQKSTRIVALARDYEPLHLDKASNWSDRNASEYYDVFVDLYLIALSRCVTYNIGGFGEWGLWMSRYASCAVRHGKDRHPILPCNWTGVVTPGYSKPADNKPTFLPPMAAVKLD
ncbi:hypothetical protein MHU86_17587 [Fragilaria crotonensis]|nr:hypothetical protein MHU86_17587 [Fragilaria crotonensis]